MPDARTSRCELCQHDIETHRITLHLKGCIRKHITGRAEDQAYEISSAPPGDWLCHIRVRSQEPDDLHRIHLLARPDAVLTDLDQTIRRLWAEPCCEAGHTSSFDRSWHTFSSKPRADEDSMDATLADLWRTKGSGPDYTFDFDLPVVCRLDQFGLWEGGSEGPVTLLARNNPIQHECQRCHQPATRAQTAMRRRKLGTMMTTLCDACAAQANGVWLPIVNSPRAGACRYGVEQEA